MLGLGQHLWIEKRWFEDSWSVGWMSGIVFKEKTPLSSQDEDPMDEMDVQAPYPEAIKS